MKASEMIPLFRGLSEIPQNFGPAIVSIGNFDGVHRGHREILSAVVREARASGVGAKAIAVTFTPHPEAFLTPEHAPRLITPGEARFELLATTRVDAILLLEFNAEFAALSAREFVERVLVQALHVRGVHEGANFRFGRNAEAGVGELAGYGEEFQFTVTVHPALHVHANCEKDRMGLEVSSSAIRIAIAAGKLNHARWMLGRVFSVESHPKRDRGVGTKLLVPTINLAAYDGLLPAFGVYASALTIAGRRFEAVTNIGNRPTFEGAGFSVESYILNFEPVELTEETPLKLEFLHRIRAEKTWPSPEALKAQIMKDVAQAKRYFRFMR
jgi:riboflavin kinase / FMN adenylyltransferase